MYVLNNPKQGEALSSVFQLYLVDAITRAQKYHGRLELNGTNQLLVYADDTNPFGENINTTKNTKVYCMLLRKSVSK
jgi:hypothetical protein